jgi:hypothetical protein
MRHFSLFDSPKEQPIKKVANTYFTIPVNMSGLSGLFDIVTWGERTGIAAPSEYQNLLEHLDQTYQAGADENGQYAVRLGENEFMYLRGLYNEFMNTALEEDFNEGGEHDDLVPEDIFKAEDALMMAQAEPSSEANLEDIPTMNTNPGEEPLKGNCPQCGVDAVDPAVRQCENCGWDEDNACPECFNDRSVALAETGNKYCNNCGWKEGGYIAPPATAAGQMMQQKRQQENELQKQFDLPSAEHPLGPHTGSNQELYTSGGFVKGPDGRWLVAIQPSGGQRDPEPGDWAQIIQRTKSFNRPVPLTLVEDMGGAWKFRNGHHPNIESQVEDETL